MMFADAKAAHFPPQFKKIPQRIYHSRLSRATRPAQVVHQ